MTRVLCRSVNEPLWVDLHSSQASIVPSQVYAWLRDPASLTRRVTQACKGSFRVAVKFQGWAGALNSETRLLQLGLREACLVREVELLCDDQPQVFARTLMPVSSLRGPARQLSRLRNKPLGKVLFANPHTRRKEVQIARIQPQHRLFRSAVSHLEQPPEELWGRRTLFLYVGKPILVNEIFLPTLVESSPPPGAASPTVCC
ncbi:chorismate--pyruvate lyase family protein [Thiolapillus sp.]